MSRGGWDDDRDKRTTESDDRLPASAEAERAPQTDPRDLRQVVRDGRGRDYRVRESEWHVLETAGTFRVVAERDLDPAADVTRHTTDLRHLADAGLIERKTAIIDHEPTRLVVLTRVGRSLLEEHRGERGLRADQRLYAGFVKPRELGHEVQLYRAFLVERDRVEAGGGRVTRVQLDYEVKRDYQAFLNRPDRPESATLAEDRLTFAEAQKLPIVDGHLEIPDLRLEVTWADGVREIRDVEVVTAHYSRGQIAGKVQAGFVLYRAGGSGSGRRSGDSAGRGGGVSGRQWEWLR